MPEAAVEDANHPNPYMFAGVRYDIEIGLVGPVLVCYTLARHRNRGRFSMGKSKNSHSIAIPAGTVFLSSFCIMVLELVAARLIARHLGSSL